MGTFVFASKNGQLGVSMIIFADRTIDRFAHVHFCQQKWSTLVCGCPLLPAKIDVDVYVSARKDDMHDYFSSGYMSVTIPGFHSL